MINLYEAMRLFKVSQATIYRWAREDAIKSKIIGGARYYDIDEMQNAYQNRHSRKIM